MKFKTEIDKSRLEAHMKISRLLGKMSRYECVHHIDCNPFNNDVGNLAVMYQNEHLALHAELRKRYPSKTIYYPEEMRKTFKAQAEEKSWNIPQIVSEHTQNCQ